MDGAYVQILSDLRRGKLSHAILIDDGTPQAREDTARKAAQVLVCTGEEKPCGVCSHCIKAAANAHADIMVFSGNGSPGSFKVDIVREIRRNASVMPNEAAVKVFILLSCETMNPAAQNALLKILEEPPQHVRFILTCNLAGSLLDTIRSRVTVYSLHTEQPAQQQARERAAFEIAGRILNSLALRDEKEVMLITAEFEKDRDWFSDVCVELSHLAFRVLVYQITGEGEADIYSSIADRFYGNQLQRISIICDEIYQAMQGNINANLLLSLFCARLFAELD